MKKKIIITAAILVLILSGGIIYLNNVFLPTRIKSLLITAIAEQTGKKVSLDSLQFSIFKGLVLKNLAIEEGEKKIISAREVSCSFLLLPIFKKSIIIPSLSIKSPAIFLERQSDNTFNLQGLFVPKPEKEKSKFQVFIYRINISNANVYFQDNTFSAPFQKNIDHLNLTLYLSLPQSVKFKAKANISAKLPMEVSGSGEYKIVQKEFSLNASLKNINPDEFSPYYESLQLKINEGLINSEIRLKAKDGIISADISAQTKGLSVSKDKLTSRMNSVLEAQVKYDLKNNVLAYSGRIGLVDSQFSGPEPVGNITSLNAGINFDNSGFSADKISAPLSGVPLEAKLKLSDYRDPLLSVDIARLKLDYLPELLKEKFKFIFPGKLKGEGSLSVKVKSSKTEGSLLVSKAQLKLEEPQVYLEDISGRIAFNSEKAGWVVQSGLITKDLKLDSKLRLENKLVRIVKLDASYFNSGLSLKGVLDTSGAAGLTANLEGDIDFNLQDLNIILNKFKAQLEQIKPDGILRAHFSLSGNLNDFKNYSIQAKVSSPEVSLYGLKLGKVLFDYNQENAVAGISSLSADFYGGIINGALNVNLDAKSIPYALDLNISGLDIEKLKKDTPLKKKDISGILSAQVKLNGVSDDIAKLSGRGNIYITKGRLWQLDLFQGMGSLLFVSDFSNIVFSEGSCSFIVRNKNIATQDLLMESSIANINGVARIGFDSQIDASFSVHVLDENVPLTGTFKDLATAIIGGAERFGTIRITGTLKEPKYKFQPAVGDIINSLKDAFFGKTD
ncbi:MAG: AsmA family protein [Candidatus Omnitrophota bacterium]|jgi:hypothetical protein